MLRRDNETKLQWKSNRKSYVAYRISMSFKGIGNGTIRRMAPLPMPLNDLEDHFCCVKPF